MKSGLKKLGTWLYCMVLNYRQTIVSFCHNTRVWQTDGRNLDSNTVRMLRSRMVKMNDWQLKSVFKNLSSCTWHAFYALLGPTLRNKYAAREKVRWSCTCYLNFTVIQLDIHKRPYAKHLTAVWVLYGQSSSMSSSSNYHHLIINVGRTTASVQI